MKEDLVQVMDTRFVCPCFYLNIKATYSTTKAACLFSFAELQLRVLLITCVCGNFAPYNNTYLTVFRCKAVLQLGSCSCAKYQYQPPLLDFLHPPHSGMRQLTIDTHNGSKPDHHI
jgi:hypothetical protein